MKTTRHADTRRLTSAAALLTSLLLASAAGAQEPPPLPDTPCESNADCGSFEGCLEGTCVALAPTDASCSADADCPDAGSVCVDGMCWAPEGGGTGIDPQPEQVCEQDADCPEGELCFDGYCSGFDTPPDDSGCAEDADCGEGGACSPTLGDCGDYAGVVAYYCHTPADECVDDADCTGTAGRGYCAYNPAAGHWMCSDAQCVG
jgi:Cys-rich repeat protein